jgi:hypothetical protein
MPDQSLLRDGPDGYEIWTGFMGWQSVEWALANRGACGKGVLPRISAGDRLYVRETWAPLSALKGNDPGVTALAEGGFYRADGSVHNDEISRWTPAIHQPRKASRLTLPVSNVRIQRLKDITDADAVAEGIEPVMRTSSGQFYKNYWNLGCPSGAYGAFGSLWSHIHGRDAWDANPFIYAPTFSVIKQNIDQIGRAAA